MGYLVHRASSPVRERCQRSFCVTLLKHGRTAEGASANRACVASAGPRTSARFVRKPRFIKAVPLDLMELGVFLRYAVGVCVTRESSWFSIPGSYLFRTAPAFVDFCAEKCVICVVAFNCLVSVWDQLWAINMTSYWPYAVRSSNICSKRFCRRTLQYLQSIRSEKKKREKTLFSYGTY